MLRAWVAVGASASLCACIDVADVAEPDAGTGGAAGSGGAAGAAGAGGGAGAASFCASHASAVFCKDFDDGKPLAFGFSEVEVMPPCTLVLNTQAVSSAPTALRSLIPANTPELDSWAYAYRDLPDATDVKLSFDILVDVSLVGTSADVAALSVDPSGQWHVANLELHANGARIELGYPDSSGTTVYDETGLTAFPLAGKWSRVEMHMVRKAPASLTVSFDGAPAGKTALPAGYMNSGLRMRVGVSYAPKQTQDLAVHYDNVLVELQ